MLDPQKRLLYLEELHPPEGYQLDLAIATTFSLDLLSLLMAPLSMIFSEQGDKDDLLKDPIVLLEALQRAKDRLAIFCQAGQILIPTVDSRLYSYLEGIVVEVQPPDTGVFHPKLWVIRFTAENEPVCYRLICLSRNLTFDRSWDTILTLDGFLDEQRTLGFGLNRPLADFIQTLPNLALGDVPSLAQAHTNTIVEEIRRVRFEPPPEFEELIAFRPSGIASPKRQPALTDHSRLLVMSPFLSETWLQTLIDYGTNNVLISRAETLDKIRPILMKQLEANTTIYIMDDAVERPDDEETQVESVDDTTMGDLSGLHAKLYIAETGWQSMVLTGSANATNAGFNGANVEFMVELLGRRSQIGIDKFLGGEDNHTTSLRSMLRLYQSSDTTPSEDMVIKEQLEALLEDARRAVSNASLSLQVIPETETTFTLMMLPTKGFTINAAVTGTSHPISLNASQAQDITSLLSGNPLIFTNMSIIGLTSFVAFELTSQRKRNKASVRFVLNLPITGLPVDRDKHILFHIISDRNHLMRYLLFLLTEGEAISLGELTKVAEGNSFGFNISHLPLLEELVRAFSRQPEKIERIAVLVDDLRQSETGQTLLPENFDHIWDAFLTLRTEGSSS